MQGGITNTEDLLEKSHRNLLLYSVLTYTYTHIKSLNGVILQWGNNVPTRHHKLTNKKPTASDRLLLLELLVTGTPQTPNITGFCQ